MVKCGSQHPALEKVQCQVDEGTPHADHFARVYEDGHAGFFTWDNESFAGIAPVAGRRHALVPPQSERNALASRVKLRMGAGATEVAAGAKASRTSDGDRKAVLELLEAHPDGLTDEEIDDALRLGLNTVRPRRGELVDDGLVMAVGRRPNRAGNAMNVWVRSRVYR